MENPSAPTTAQAVAAFLNSMRAARRSPSYLGKLGYLLRFLEDACPGELPCTLDGLEAFFAAVQASGRLGEATYYDLWRHTKQLYAWCKGRYAIASPFDVPAVHGGLQRPGLRPKILPAFSEQEKLRILMRNEGRPREMAVLLLMLDTMIRPGEAFNLRPPDIHAGHVVFHGKRGERQLPISPQTQRALLALPPGEVLWRGRKGPLTREGFKQMIKRAERRAGLSGGGYKLRHTAATLFLRRGGDAINLKRLLGHTSMAMTERYVDQSLEMLAEAQRRFSPIADYQGSYQPALTLVEQEMGAAIR